MKSVLFTFSLVFLGVGPLLAGDDTWTRAVEAYRAQDYATAATLFNQVADERPNFAAAHDMLGRTYLKLGESQKAKLAFRACLNHQPSNQPARLSLAMTLLEEKSWRAAMAELEQVETSELRGQQLKLFLELKAKNSLALGQPESVLSVASEGIAEFPDSAVFHEVKGQALWQLKKEDQAFVALETSLNLDSSNLTKRKSLVRKLLSSDRQSDYHRAAELATDIPTDSSEDLALRGRAFLFGQEFAKAESSLEKASALRPQDGDTAYYLGLSHLYQKQWQAAKQAFQRSLELDLDSKLRPSCTKRLARSLEGLGEKAEARALYLELGALKEVERLDKNQSIIAEEEALDEIRKLEAELELERELLDDSL